jgi:hypothetical protein
MLTGSVKRGLVWKGALLARQHLHGARAGPSVAERLAD